MRVTCIACLLMCFACQGERGPAGRNGRNGVDGDDGETGLQGPMGMQGAQGLPGPMGVKGETGAAGPPGTNGERGPAGPAGQPSIGAMSTGGNAYRPSGWARCVAVLDLLDGAELGEDDIPDTALEYALTVFSNDDVDARCGAVVAGSGAVMSSAYYPGVTNLAAVAPCSITADYPPFPQGGSIPGYWELTLEEGVPTATYYDNDTNHPLDGITFEYVEEDCDAFVMDLGGMWYESSLAEVF